MNEPVQPLRGIRVRLVADLRLFGQLEALVAYAGLCLVLWSAAVRVGIMLAGGAR